MKRIKVKTNFHQATNEDSQIADDLAEIQLYLEHYSVKYPNESTIDRSIEQLRVYVPHKKRLLQQLFSNLGGAIYHVLPVHQFASFSLFLLGSLLLPSKLY
ncbi:hypothetical protein EHS13_28690 [Paenibacillus psychroresistens]|uniref:Uncharacterized protein n=1 Tax=Paenibacillus psychroresistens TaxID=1778678 RepID=A0A6B8RRY9_9BACL|nr:hypothetical protein [Paenibacillus psychroresistens]QGQ98574.1 hypothetical protein EHS13_28690 [Paenibacillus psychroresistens]